MGPVPTAYVERNIRNAPNDGRWADQQVTDRVPVQETQQDAPLPVNYTRAWPLGKTFDHAWGHVWQFITLNIQSINSIVAPNFLVQRGVKLPVITMAGAQNPIRARANINAPQTGSNGQRVAVYAPPTYILPANYTKLM